MSKLTETSISGTSSNIIKGMKCRPYMGLQTLRIIGGNYKGVSKGIALKSLKLDE